MKINCSINGVPRITAKYTLITLRVSKLGDILPIAMGRASGREKVSVRKKISRDTNNPCIIKPIRIIYRLR
ncbi:MAG: hypothetical protein Ta2G_05310 [Termitinemataceae bacterium]|nr:MAG: hypothetical protein Ta2G_05310 [Termitinemataceae bacterium]